MQRTPQEYEFVFAPSDLICRDLTGLGIPVQRFHGLITRESISEKAIPNMTLPATQPTWNEVLHDIQIISRSAVFNAKNDLSSKRVVIGFSIVFLSACFWVTLRTAPIQQPLGNSNNPLEINLNDKAPPKENRPNPDEKAVLCKAETPGRTLDEDRGNAEAVFGSISFHDIGSISCKTWPSAVAYLKPDIIVSGHIDVDLDESAAGSLGVPRYLKNKGWIQTWDIRTRKALQTIPLPGGVRGLALDPTGKRIAIVGHFTHVAVADVSNLANWKQWRCQKNAALTDVVFSPDGQRTYASTTDGRLLVFDATSGQQLNERRIHKQTQYSDRNSIVMSPNGAHLLYWSDQSQGTYVVHLKPELSVELLPHSNGPALFLNKDDEIIYANNYDIIISGNLIDQTELYRHVLGSPAPQRAQTVYQFRVDTLSYHPSTDVIVGDSKGVLHCMNSKTMSIRTSHQAHTRSIRGIALSSDRRTIASVGWNNLVIQFTSTQSLADPPSYSVDREDVALLASCVADRDNSKSNAPNVDFTSCWKRLLKDSHPDVVFCRNAILELGKLEASVKLNEAEFLVKQVKIAADVCKEIAKGPNEEVFTSGHLALVFDYVSAHESRMQVVLSRRQIAEHRLAIWNRLIYLMRHFAGKEQFSRPPIELSFKSVVDFTKGTADVAGFPGDVRVTKWNNGVGPIKVRLKNVSGRMLKNCSVSLTLYLAGEHPQLKHIGSSFAKTHFFVTEWANEQEFLVAGKGTIGGDGSMFYLVTDATMNIYESQGRHYGKRQKVDPLQETRDVVSDGDNFVGKWSVQLQVGNKNTKSFTGDVGMFIVTVKEPKSRRPTSTSEVFGLLYDPSSGRSTKSFVGQFDRYTGQLDFRTSAASGPAVPGNNTPVTMNLLRKGEERGYRAFVATAEWIGCGAGGIELKMHRQKVSASRADELRRAYQSNP